MRVLFITATRIGDAILSTGALRHLLDRWPSARLTIACGPDAAPLFEAVPNLDGIIVLDKRPRAGHWRELWRRTAARPWSLVVDGRRSLVARLVPHARIRVMPMKAPGEHTVEQVSRMMESDVPLDPYIWTSPAHVARAESLVPEEAPVLAVAPTANWPGKIWPPERFATVVGDLTRPGGLMAGAQVAVFAAPAERAAALRAVQSVPADRLIDLAGTVGLLEAYACLKRCSLFIGNDSALMHMAAASGVPTVGLFGPSKVEHYAPWGELTAVARTDLSYDEILALPDYDHRLARTWMESLRVETVLDVVRDLWSRTGRIAAE